MFAPHESDNHINAGAVSVGNVKETMRMTSILTVPTLSTSIEMSAK